MVITKALLWSSKLMVVPNDHFVTPGFVGGRVQSKSGLRPT
jgi:hypothetical protein